MLCVEINDILYIGSRIEVDDVMGEGEVSSVFGCGFNVSDVKMGEVFWRRI